ncbi:adhesion G-protein coupled receptor G7-like [Babylonia areolata]|uniref:adhesion G-protein coupled receptor G7-like n=1 Tax=Babylonia areolata TaxID=304850 RepID=UPI003FD2AC2C
MSLQPFYYAFLLPVAVILLVNVVIYVLVVIHICRRGGSSSAMSVRAGRRHQAVAGRRGVGIRASFACCVVLGLSWLFAFLALGDARVVFQYLFTLTTSVQGLLIFLVFTARDANVLSVLRRLTRRVTRSGSSTSRSSSDRSSSVATVSSDTARIRSTV